MDGSPVPDAALACYLQYTGHEGHLPPDIQTLRAWLCSQRNAERRS